MSLSQETIASLRQRLLKKEITATDIVQDLASRIEQHDPKIGAYLSLDLPAALKEAEKADLGLPLGGIPIAIKDNINVQGQPCTCASKILAENYHSPYDAGSIISLRRSGAIPMGRLNMDEFAMGSSTENSALGVTRNPWDLERCPGGSSGGSAAAVAADLAIAALGSDTGGSIRQPAAFCGCVGLKPTYGRVSRYGLVAFASSLDQIGPLTKTVEDSALLLNHLCGKDPRDSTSLDLPAEDFTTGLTSGVKGLKIGVPREYLERKEGIHPDVLRNFSKATELLEHLGAEISFVDLPHTDVAIATYYILAPAEASTNLARFDGVRYGHRTKNLIADSKAAVLDNYELSRSEGFGPEVKRRILLGTYVLSSGYYDAYYIKAQRARTLIRADFMTAFEKVDVIATPTTPVPAPLLGEHADDPLSIYLADIFTIPPNLAGLPALSLPCEDVLEKGRSLPMGLQLIGRPLDEAKLLRTAHAFEKNLPKQKRAAAWE